MTDGWHKFDHVGIVVKPGELEKVLEFYKKLFGFEMPNSGPYQQVVDTKDMGRYCLISSRGTGEEHTFIEFFEPPKEATHYVDTLLRGVGAIAELCITVDDIEKWFDKVKKMGYTPINHMTGKPMKDKSEIVQGEVTKSRWFHLPTSETFGTWIEILERPGKPYGEPKKP